MGDRSSKKFTKMWFEGEFSNVEVRISVNFEDFCIKSYTSQEEVSKFYEKKALRFYGYCQQRK